MTDEPVEPEVTELLIACVDFIRRMGAKGIQIRFSDDEEPVIWFLVAEFERDGKQIFETAASLMPDQAAARLCELLTDAGRCRHCNKSTGFTTMVDGMPVNDIICWYQYDPELKTIRRGCE